MKKHIIKHGFTIVEVSLFLALSGFLMVGLILGANISIARQRYNDSVNSFADFIRGAYADTLNVANENTTIDTDGSTAFIGGRTTTAIYGKFITFGETDGSNAVSKTIYAYDVVGKAISSSAATSSTVLEMLKNELSANIIQSDCAAAVCTNTFYGMRSYIIPWDGEIQNPNNDDGSLNKTLFTGAALIVRSPTTGGIRTYIYRGDISDFHKSTDLQTNASNLFKTLLDSNVFKEEQLDLCLDSPDNNLGNRRDFRILARANNSTGVTLVGLNDEDSVCLGR
ncbi:hypothetical protein IJG96_00940 [Candidatus Saccharibacteria bacterium]|nr:hypothetical protein [Candidatus Saccharibacteria bacterium]